MTASAAPQPLTTSGTPSREHQTARIGHIWAIWKCFLRGCSEGFSPLLLQLVEP